MPLSREDFLLADRSEMHAEDTEAIMYMYVAML